ncbi:uncharacterized protein SPSC_05701 [Sporisorium scitamineum]|uniref:Uncharacterized protein n=1 Tax=Sporisorium scitamineum TaxID=49012 RepID=A0A0F7RUX7_9BASI|nr:uncharacterized protein SPSC_05701 [Sporisorium scitamineum]CDS00726.1 hypothetical protein [Sporisorium scitamineum]
MSTTNKHSAGSYAKSFLDSLFATKNGSLNHPQSFSSSSTTATVNIATSSAPSSAATSIGAAPLLTAAFKPHKPSSLSSSASASASEDGTADRDAFGYDAYLPSTLLSQAEYGEDQANNNDVDDDDDASSMATSPPLSSSFKAQQLSLQALSHHRTFSSSSSRRTSTSAPAPDYTADILAMLNDQHLDEEERIDKVRATLANALYAIEGVPSPSARIDNLVLDLMHRHREDVQPTGVQFPANPNQSPVRRPASIRSFSTSRPWTPTRPSFSPATSFAGTPTELTPSAFGISQRPTSPHLGSSALASLTSTTSPVWSSASVNTAASPRPHPGVIGSGSPRASPKPWNRTLSNLSTTSLTSSNGAAPGAASPISSLPPGVIGNAASRPASPSPFGSPKLNIAATEFKPRTGSSTNSAAASAAFTPTRPAPHLVRRPSSNASSSNLALANKSHAGAGDDDDDEFSPFGTIKPAQQQPLSFAGFTTYDPDAGWTSAQSLGGADAYKSSWPDSDASAAFGSSEGDASGPKPTAPLTPFDMLYSILVTGTKAGSSEWSPEQVDEALVMHNYDVEKTLNAIWENEGKPLGDGTRSLLSSGPSAPRMLPVSSAISSPRFVPAQLPATAGVKAGVNVMSREALGLSAARGQRPALSRSGSSQLTPRYEGAGAQTASGASANRVCRYYLAGECRRSDCRFSHDLDNRAVCRYWLKGHCAHNPCNFLHDYDALNQLATGIVSGLHVNDAGTQQAAAASENVDAWGAMGGSNGANDDFPKLGAGAKDVPSKTSYAATLGGGADPSRNRWTSTVQKRAPTDAAAKAQSDNQGVISIHSKAAPIRSQPFSSALDSKSTSKGASTGPRASARLPLRPSALLPTLLTGSSAAETYQTHRSDALSLAEQRNKLLARASEAYRRGDVASAKKFSKEASSLNHQYEDESRTAAHAIVKERMRELRSRLNDPNASGSNASCQSNEAGARNLRGKIVGSGLGLCLGVVRPGSLQGSQASSIAANLSVDERTECLLDLHGLHAKEAVELTEEFLLGLEAEGLQGLAYLAIGKAKHSSRETDKRRVKVGGFIKQFLSSYSYPFAESDGVLVVDHLTHS